MPQRTNYRHFGVLLFDRSDPDEIVAVSAKGGRRWTRLEELREAQTKGAFGGGRSDIVMVNIQSGKVQKQLVAYPTWSGEPRGEAMDYLTPDELKQAREINRKMVEAAEQHPEMGVYLGWQRPDGEPTREWIERTLAAR